MYRVRASGRRILSFSQSAYQASKFGALMPYPFLLTHWESDTSVDSGALASAILSVSKIGSDPTGPVGVCIGILT